MPREGLRKAHKGLVEQVKRSRELVQESRLLMARSLDLLSSTRQITQIPLVKMQEDNSLAERVEAILASSLNVLKD
jgi:hypothetical protein